MLFDQGDTSSTGKLGRRQIAQHAVFVSRIRAIRARQRRLLLTDAACGQLADAGPMGCRHQIRVLSRRASNDEIIACDIAGRTGDPFGYLAMNCKLPDAAPGDFLVFRTAGVLPEHPVSEPAAQYLLREDGSVVSLTVQAENGSAL